MVLIGGSDRWYFADMFGEVADANARTMGTLSNLTDSVQVFDLS